MTMNTQLKMYAVTIADTVHWHTTIAAASEDEAHNRAWDLFGSNDRGTHFTDRSETSLTAEEVLI
jgi:hypothetical protein